MNAEPPNPYQAPKEGPLPLVSSKPPITPVRLVIGLVLITIAWSGIWAKVREGMSLGFFVCMLSSVALAWVVDPSARKRKTLIKPWGIVRIVVLVVPLVYLVKSSEGTALGRWLDEVIAHPAALIGGWLLSCGVLMLTWWKRRNNPPYQPEPQPGSL